MINLFKKTFRYILLHMLKYIPGVQGVYDEAVRKEPRSLAFVPDCFKKDEMCNKVVEKHPNTLWHVSVHLRTEEMCIKVVEKYLYPLKFVSDHLRPRRCVLKQCTSNHTLWNLFLTVLRPKKCVTRQCAGNRRHYIMSLITSRRRKSVKKPLKISTRPEFVPDWFVTQQQIKSWDDYDDYWNDVINFLSGTMGIKTQGSKSTN